MTADRIKDALVTVLDQAKPSSTITVSDAQSFDDTSLPQLSVDIAGVEQHSPTLPGVQKIGFEIVLRAHSGDEAAASRTTIEGWCDQIETTINDPSLMKSLLTGNADGAQADYWLAAGGVPEWDEATLRITWDAECWAVRTR